MVIELGKIIVEIICLTHWKLGYILDEITLDQAMLIHKYGKDFEETKAIILLNKVIEVITGKKKPRNVDIDKPPPKYNELKAMFGDRVKPILNEKKVK